MAAHQSSPLCAPPGLLLLLLIGVISTHLPEVLTKPIDFWCNNVAREMMRKRIEDKADCMGSDTLAAPVQLPCVGVTLTEWANKTLQQKRAELLGSLQVIHDGVKGVKNQTTMQCQTSLLEKLEHSTGNILAIVHNLHIQNDELTTSHPAVQNYSSNTSLNEVFTHYRKLLIGKLELFAVDLHDSVCREDHRTINYEGS